ncbi:MAG: class I tRNA ligase family protein, partial [Anaerolineaceae bacterium]
WSTILEEVPGGNASNEVIRRLNRKTHQTLRSVTHDFENFEFNTIISSLMELMNEMNKAKAQGAWGTVAWEETVSIYLRMLAPIAPHISEELWELIGNRYSVHLQAWPVVDEEAAAEEKITLVVQINGKLRDRIDVPVDIADEDAKNLAMNSENVKKFMEGKTPRQVIYVKGRLVNIVV